MTTNQPALSRVAPYVIQPLGPADRPRILAHLLALDADDRRLRFGAGGDAEVVARYVSAIDFDTGSVLGACAPDGSLLGVAHVARGGTTADLGISVVPGARQQGVAGALAAAALREARRTGAREFRFDSSATNAGMRHLARQLGMHVCAEGTELVACRMLDGASDARA